MMSFVSNSKENIVAKGENACHSISSYSRNTYIFKSLFL